MTTLDSTAPALGTATSGDRPHPATAGPRPPAQAPSRLGEVCARGLWLAPRPLRLSGYPDDPDDAHIVRGLD
ncbi:hypothetical protein [Streptomyces malaysiense]|uniref:Uncharacterized protein n=1 Tax=Streptomyces malaysiense TaxID=1428626 RepID=A0A1J4Q6Z9_9ACTN|nr:hypothetical protein [Streptomyces malaysiense]OIK27919.1 hypothetical protein VT52_009050 [Streptomyces malaysiense]